MHAKFKFSVVTLQLSHRCANHKSKKQLAVPALTTIKAVRYIKIRCYAVKYNSTGVSLGILCMHGCSEKKKGSSGHKLRPPATATYASFYYMCFGET